MTLNGLVMYVIYNLENSRGQKPATPGGGFLAPFP